jgi:hypothetical protein
MDGIDTSGTARDRRGRAVIVRLVERYQAAREPHKWLQALTLNAIRALDKANASPADKSAARHDIHAIRREVVSQVNALALLRQSAEDPGVTVLPAPIALALSDPEFPLGPLQSR